MSAIATRRFRYLIRRGIEIRITSALSSAAGLKLNPAPHVPDDIVDSVLQQFQPALERRGIRHNGMGGKEGCCDRWKRLERVDTRRNEARPEPISGLLDLFVA